MNYDKGYNTAEVSVPSQPSMLSCFESSLQEHLADQASIINRIESKLHQIVNKRVPEKEPKSEQSVPMETDVLTRLSKLINKIVENNTNLERISKHLSEIV